MELASANLRNVWTTIVGVSLAAVGLLVWIIYFKEQPEGSEGMLPFLPLLNCILNGTSAFCLVAGVLAIRKKRQNLHMKWMMAAFACSAVFLVSYILHHYLHGDSVFPKDNDLRPFYLMILASHVVLSVIGLPMILMTFFLSLSGRIDRHRKLARYTFPIWLYVSVTGVLVYVLLKSAGA